MAEQEVLVTTENLEYYQEELIKKLPKEQIWNGPTAPSQYLGDEFLFAINSSNNKAYYRLANKKWQMIGSEGDESSEIVSKVTMSRISSEYLYISPDDKTCEISFRWICTVNGKQMTTKGDINIFINSKQVKTLREAPGIIKVDVREFLKEGTNSVTIEVRDAYGTAKKLTFQVEVVKLTLLVSGYTQNTVTKLKEFEEEHKNDESEDMKGIPINITVLGEVKKKIHLIIEGKEYEGNLPSFDAGRDVRTIYVPKPAEKPHGSYLIELYASYTFEATGKTIYSNSIFYDMIWYDNISPKREAIIASTFTQTKGKQYETLKIPYYIFKAGYETYYVKYSILRKELNEETGKNEYVIIEEETPQRRTVEEQLEWITNSKLSGDVIFRIEVGDLVEKKKEPEDNEQLENSENIEEEIEYEFNREDYKDFYLTLEEQSKPNISRVERQMPFEFIAEKIDNNSSDRDLWMAKLESGFPWKPEHLSSERKAIEASFSNKFDWKSNGWEMRDGRHALKISNGASLTIPIPIFDLNSYYPNYCSFYQPEMGFTIEIDLSFDEVSDTETDFFTCFEFDNEEEDETTGDETTGDETDNTKINTTRGRGIRISPSRALLTNGEKTAKIQYSDSESKNYNNSMRFSFVINPQQDRYIPQRPYEIAQGKQPVYKDTLGSMLIYVNGVGATASEYSATSFAHSQLPTFTSEGCTVHLHSFRIYRRALLPNEILRNWIYDMNVNDLINAYNTNWIYNEGGETILYDKVKERIPCMIITGEKMPTYKSDKQDVSIRFEGTEDGLYDFELPLAQIDVQGTSSQYYPVKNWKFKAKSKFYMTGLEEERDKYALADDQIPAKVFCLKADYMETSSTHNTSTANLANSMYDDETYGKTPPQREDEEGKTRTTIYGRPIVVFYENPKDDTLTFGGKYNFNYDKDAEEVFGFAFENEDDQKKYEVIDCVEFRDNSIKMCQFTEPFSTQPVEGLSEAQLKEYDDYSKIPGTTQAEAWGNAFEFRHHYHREEGTQHYSYFEAVADWVYSRNSEGFTGEKLQEEYIVETGNAKFLYTNESKIETFSDGTNTRRALNLGGISAEEADYKVQTYFIQKNYKKSINSVTGKEELTETETIIDEKEAYVRDTGDDAWNAVKDQYDKESYSREEGQKAWNKFVEDYIAENGEAAWDEVKDKYNEAEYIKTSGEKAWDKLVTSYKEQPWNELIQTPSSEDNETKIVTNLYNALFWDEEKGAEVYIFDRDTRNYRLTRFKNELPEHFNEHYCLMYFLLMELLAMIDSGTKNMFWATWGERHENHPILNVSKDVKDYNVIWYPIFYDMDSILGLNNVGKMNIPYSVDFDSRFEDFSDAEDTGHCFNGANNVFWLNFKEAYITELNLLFNEKVTKNTFSLSKLLKLYEEHSSNFPASIYNEDGKLKIIDKYFQGYFEATPDEIADEETKLVPKFPDWMYVYQGDRYYYRRFWLPNRFNYLLSKNFSGSYARDFISMRLYDPNRGKGPNEPRVHTDYDFYITTWKDQYTTVRYGSRAISVKCPAGVETKIDSPSSSYNDTETGVYGASNLKYIGSMSAKYLTTLDLSSAINLLEIDLGNEDANYRNDALKTLTFGANDMLRKINIQNCYGLTGNLNVQSCKNITEINARGTRITGVDLSKDSAILETLYLPQTTTQLVLNNQTRLENFELPKNGQRYQLNKLIIKNTPKINTKELVENSIDSLRYLHLTNINWTGENSLINDTLLFKIKNNSEKTSNKLQGAADNTKPVLNGVCYVDSIRDFLEDELNVFFNDVDSIEELNEGALKLDKNHPEKCQRKFILLGSTQITRLLKFMKHEYGSCDPYNNDDIIDINLNRHHINMTEKALVVSGLKPTKKPEWDRTYEFIGWNGQQTKRDKDGKVTLDAEGNIQWFDIVNQDGTKKLFLDNDLYQTPVMEDMIFYPVFKAIPKTFTFTFKPKNKEGVKEDEKLYIEKENDAVYVNEVATITLISDDFVNDYGNETDKENGTYSDYTSQGIIKYKSKAIAPKIKDLDKAYDLYTYRYKKWKILGTNKIIVEDESFRILTAQPELKNQYSSDEDSTQIRNFNYIVEFDDYTFDQKYIITLLNNNGEPLTEWNRKVFYKGQTVKIPILSKASDANYSYNFFGWLPEKDKLTLLDYPDRIINDVDKSKVFLKVQDSKIPDISTNGEDALHEYFKDNNYVIILKPTYIYTIVHYQIKFHYILGGLNIVDEISPEGYPDKNVYIPTQSLVDDFGTQFEGGLLYGQQLRLLSESEALTKYKIEGYHFVGWRDSQGTEYDKYDISYLTVESNMEYFVIAEKKEFEVCFNYLVTGDKDNESNTVGTLKYWPSDKKLKYGDSIKNKMPEAVSNTIKSGYETHWELFSFNGWDNEVIDIVTQEATYDATYTNELKYYVTFTDRHEKTTKYGPFYNNAIVEAQTADESYGDEDSTYDSRYDLVRWYTDSGVKLEYNRNTKLFDNLTVSPGSFGQDSNGIQIQKLNFKLEYQRYRKYWVTFCDSNGNGLKGYTGIKYYTDSKIFPPSSDYAQKIFKDEDEQNTYTYTFIGWCKSNQDELLGTQILDNSGNSTNIETLFKNENSNTFNISLRPLYSRVEIPYSITFHYIPGGSPGLYDANAIGYSKSKIINLHWGDEIVPPKLDEMSDGFIGYNFDETWSTVKTTEETLKNGTNLKVTLGNLDDTTKLTDYYARWTIKELDVSFYHIPTTDADNYVKWNDVDDKYKLAETQKVLYGDLPTSPKDIYKNNPYSIDKIIKFSMWPGLTTPVFENKKYYAQYSTTPRTYDITFADHEGNEIETITYAYGETPSYEGPKRTGYTFVDWSPKITAVTGKQTYKATYDVNLHTVTYIGYSGFNGYSSEKIEEKFTDIPFGGKIPPPTKSFTRKGYDFVRWDKDNTIPMPDEDMVFNAVYSIQTFTINWQYPQDDPNNLSNTRVVTRTYNYNPSSGPTPPSTSQDGYAYGSKMNNQNHIYLGFSEVPSKVTAGGTYTAIVGVLESEKGPYNWGTDGIDSATYNDVTDTADDGFKAQRSAANKALRQIYIKTPTICGSKKMIYNFRISYKAISDTEHGWFADINAGLCDTKGIDETYTSNKIDKIASSTNEFNSPLWDSISTESMSITLNSTTKDHLTYSDGEQYTWFGLQTARATTVQVKFKKVQFWFTPFTILQT